MVEFFVGEKFVGEVHKCKHCSAVYGRVDHANGFKLVRISDVTTFEYEVVGNPIPWIRCDECSLIKNRCIDCSSPNVTWIQTTRYECPPFVSYSEVRYCDGCKSREEMYPFPIPGMDINWIPFNGHCCKNCGGPGRWIGSELVQRAGNYDSYEIVCCSDCMLAWISSKGPYINWTEIPS